MRLSYNFIHLLRLNNLRRQIICLFLQLEEHLNLSIYFSLNTLHIYSKIQMWASYCLITLLSLLLYDEALFSNYLKMISKKLLFHIFYILHQIMVLKLELIRIQMLMSMFSPRYSIRFISGKLILLLNFSYHTSCLGLHINVFDLFINLEIKMLLSRVVLILRLNQCFTRSLV